MKHYIFSILAGMALISLAGCASPTPIATNQNGCTTTGINMTNHAVTCQASQKDPVSWASWG
ncbi:hypothetical protein KB20921_02220 [Edwardsiella ictaluri]|nr:hypothetical protein KB20921_02220 [Edwardsiella ictaluri]BEI04437.1 hypothetical protein KH201010_02230 [Edwardsiella ictaluri]BEI07891.1 hypothetical protein STU22726_02220 [Edwardsiella ictaluri]BEI14850.1 hypothetical protein STA22820_02230 [Edwardsiella ictaluri]